MTFDPNNTQLITSITKRFLTYKELGEKTFAQLNDQQIHWKHQEEDNSIYIIIKHMHGNMRSRFTDFLNSDGEKSWRKRDEEFTTDIAGPSEMIRLWNEGWDCLIKALKPLQDADLQKVVTIRNEKHTVADALLRQLTHYAYHVGQIIYIAKTLKGKDWQNLSVPKNRSEEYIQKKKDEFKHEK